MQNKKKPLSWEPQSLFSYRRKLVKKYTNLVLMDFLKNILDFFKNNIWLRKQQCFTKEFAKENFIYNFTDNAARPLYDLLLLPLKLNE